MDSINPRTSIENPPKPKTFSSSKQLEFHLANVYSEISEMIDQREDLEIQMPAEVPTAIERVNLIKSVLGYLLQERKNTGKSANDNDGNGQDDRQKGDNSCIFQCKDCENYEKNLQKLQGEVRNHIRTHQQLKLYQDGLEQKIEQYKKQKKQIEKKYESLKKKYEQMKYNVSSNTERMSKFESENQKLKQQLKNYRPGIKVSNEDQAKKLNRYESNKENLNDWRSQNNQRTSAQRRHESTERMRVSVNVKSSKGIPLGTKIIQDKHHREDHQKEKQKNIKHRIGYGY